MQHDERVVILDFGSQYTQLIARRVREVGVYAEILPYTTDPAALAEEAASGHLKGLILSGGPASVYAPGAPTVGRELFDLGVPTLGICYGLQLMADRLGGTVDRAAAREFGRATLLVDGPDEPLFHGLADREGHGPTVWMSHGDHLTALPDGFKPIAHTTNAAFAAIRHEHKPLYGVQFHPEVVHTPRGGELLRNFLYAICGCSGGWTAESVVEATIRDVRAKVGSQNVLLGLSGGVDSSVAAVLLHRALGDQLVCVFVDNGLLREGEAEQVVSTFRDAYGIRLIHVDAADRFLLALTDVIDPEAKRKAIGRVFVEVFDAEAAKLTDVAFLAQGTLYPDVIESVSIKGPSATIKTHHNVGGLPDGMALKLVEPFRELFKDEVRAVGRLLGVPEAMVGRHPFPGPGLAIRILGAVTPERLALLRRADTIFLDELHKGEIDGKSAYDSVWQAFAVLLPVQSVGVMGDERTYEQAIALRAVTSVDGMTADWAHLPYDLLGRASNRIINEVRGINRVVYDISSKPPATIEWE